MERTKAFGEQLARYKKAIDADISTYAAHVRRTTQEQYGEHSAAVTSAYLDMLGQGGKRIRGALAMVGYKMCGGADEAMITRAATALEMVHAYILIIDDIQDRSKLRRGKPTVHEQLAAYHQALHLKGDTAHTGTSLALNAALTGAHAAQMLFAGLSVEAELKVKVLGIVNHTMVVTAHGQTTDIMNELVPSPSSEDITHALEWKTAHYTILNPLCVGMVLAGAGCEDTDAIRAYALHTGRAFQITDDIIGIFGDDEQTGKSSMDDVREGKQTILTLYASEHVSVQDRALLGQCLGNEQLSVSDFERVREIIRSSGALDHARQLAIKEGERAVASLRHTPVTWRPEQVQFLDSLARQITERNV
jgi:geranylgeranyl diphosphate synthase type I